MLFLENVCSHLLDPFYHRRFLNSTEKLFCMCIFEWPQPFKANSSQPLAEAGVFFAVFDKKGGKGACPLCHRDSYLIFLLLTWLQSE